MHRWAWIGFLAASGHLVSCAQSGSKGSWQFANHTSGFLGDSTFINVQAFGAVPNDGQDDSAAFQSAISYLQTNPLAHKGGTLYIPVGEYDFATPISVNNAGIRFVCDGGLSFNEGGEGFYTGAAFIAKTNGMILLDFNGDPNNNGSIIHQGPQLENCNFVDQTVSGHTATLIRIRSMNRYVIRNVTVRGAATGIAVDAAEVADASWGRLDQIICHDTTTCVDQVTQEGGFLMTGGDMEPRGGGVGVRIRGAQVRLMGVKFDLPGASPYATAIYDSGNAPQIIGNEFEGCGPSPTPCIQIDGSGGNTWNGARASIAGNRFRGINGSSGEVAINLANNPKVTDNQIVGNTYEVVQNPVVDAGVNTVRFDQSATMARSSVFANLPAWPNGSFIYCIDCRTSTAPCASSGTGAFAVRENNTWNCH